MYHFSVSFFYKIMQQLAPGSFFISKLVLVATSKTSSTPSPVSALHSMYFLAPTALATCFASSMGTISSVAFSLKWASCLKSFFKPTRTIGASGQYRNASSAHFVLALISDSKLSTANPINIISAFEYENGRKRSYSSCPAVSQSVKDTFIPSTLQSVT
ncbi:EC1118_1N9_2773p [Saccharomyces cerevisiae EC1118]|uniref:EC1118_1N9_2773p n=1 Tax=Saccharomyces cerevisiae (strain Lalvin EC1118 / Prise de mousse) TaxID=643680 RepID=C8ZGE2_YEAS8|nr:EC1118_1N9_2773p [Saccharomyces cerevisiae EC1118]